MRIYTEEEKTRIIELIENEESISSVALTTGLEETIVVLAILNSYDKKEALIKIRDLW